MWSLFAHATLLILANIFLLNECKSRILCDEEKQDIIYTIMFGHDLASQGRNVSTLNAILAELKSH